MGRRQRDDARWVSDGLKSVAAAGVLCFVLLVVLEGEIRRHNYKGIVSTGRGVSFCDGWLADVPVLEALPCFVLNVVVVLAAWLTLIGSFVIARAAGRALRRA